MKALKTWEDADEALHQLGIVEIELERIEQKLTLDTQKLKVAATEKATGPATRAAELRDALETFWLANRGDLAATKSWKGAFGKIGQRGSRAVKLLRGWTLKKILPLLPDHLVHIKRTLDKDAVLKCEPKDLAKLRERGIGIEERETFFAEPDREKIRAEEIPA